MQRCNDATMMDLKMPLFSLPSSPLVFPPSTLTSLLDGDEGKKREREKKGKGAIWDRCGGRDGMGWKDGWWREEEGGNWLGTWALE